MHRVVHPLSFSSWTCLLTMRNEMSCIQDALQVILYLSNTSWGSKRYAYAFGTLGCTNFEAIQVSCPLAHLGHFGFNLDSQIQSSVAAATQGYSIIPATENEESRCKPGHAIPELTQGHNQHWSVLAELCWTFDLIHLLAYPQGKHLPRNVSLTRVLETDKAPVFTAAILSAQSCFESVSHNH